MLSGKNILIGICGGIAAYKICELIRMFKRKGANVRVVCTPNALNFVTKLTLRNLSQNEVGVEEFDIPDFKPEHISYADETDIMIIAPATANTISKIASGICDNLLTSIVCAFKKPVIIAPAMNCNMWENPAIQENLKKLSSRGYKILAPESGYLACGYEGKGRLCSLEKIYDEAAAILTSKNRGKKYVITAGGTIEDIDPVRYISNYSSGKMGIALADEAYRCGNNVTLITTVDVARPYKIIKVKSAIEMQQTVNSEFEAADFIIMAAAVADYRVKNKSGQKIKKTNDDTLTLELVKNPDILKGLCERKREELLSPEAILPENKFSAKEGKQVQNDKIIVGFCAESENLLANAKEKIQKKGCDYLIANDISRKDIGFSSDYNEVTIIKKNGEMTKLERASKTEIAREILKVINE